MAISVRARKRKFSLPPQAGKYPERRNEVSRRPSYTPLVHFNHKEIAMYLKQKHEGHLIEVLSIADLVNPRHPTVAGRSHYGEEIQEPENFSKSDLEFASGEALPRCWVDAHYRDKGHHK
jgi:hypothetical protein